jgi:hypothetical protein
MSLHAFHTFHTSPARARTPAPAHTRVHTRTHPHAPTTFLGMEGMEVRKQGKRKDQ